MGIREFRVLGQRGLCRYVSTEGKLVVQKELPCGMDTWWRIMALNAESF